MTSISSIYKNKDKRGDITVNKTYMVPIDKLFIEYGFNVRSIDDNHVDSICESYCNGEHLPPLVVKPREDGSMKIIDGHHRYKAALLAIEKGVEIKRLQCESFTGSESDMLAYMIKSSQGRNLNAIERGLAYIRYEAQGFTRDEVAKKVGRSRGDIENHILIAEMPDEVKDKILSGEISATLALELYSKSGVVAVDDAIDKAKLTGAKRATKKHTSLWKPKLGKESLQKLRSASVLSESNDEVLISVSPDDWEFVQRAMAALDDKSGE